MPPQSNHLYVNKYSGGRKCSRDYNLYKADVSSWSFLNRQKVLRARDIIKRWTREPLDCIRVTTHFGFPRSKLITRLGKLKRLDASNRIKACHDTLADILDIDDMRFSAGEYYKVIADKPGVLIVLQWTQLTSMRTSRELYL